MSDPNPLGSPTAGSSQIPSPPASKEASGAPRIRRRNRVIASCLECRRRKLKCDKSAPCSNCAKFRRDCLYLAPALDSVSQQKLAEIKDKMGSLEQSLERDVVRQNSSDKIKTKVEIDSDEEDLPEYEDEKDLEPTPFASLDNVYEDDADDDLMDLGVQLGKMRVSERIGGFVRPKMAEELTSWGQQGSARGNLSSPPPPQSADMPASSQNWLLTDSPAVYLGPGPDYLPPASGFFFPNSGANSLQDMLPSRATCDKLFEQYWHAVHPVVTIVHKPTFRNLYNLFWQHVMIGTEPPASTQAVIFACLFNAAVSLAEESTLQVFGVPRALLVEKIQASTEKCLAKANFLRTTKLETMQAFVMYLVPLCRAEVSRSHSALTGTAIRLAECMGLHRDGTHYGFSAVETHVRRLIWYHLCFLDIRTCEATGPRPQIHKDDFDTKLPLNVNEENLLQDPPPTEDLPYFTDMTLSRIRFECTEAHRQIWVDNRRIDQKKLKHTVALHRVQKFRTDMETRYLPLLAGSDPRQNLAMHLYRILSSRLFIMLLHRFFAGARTPLPERLKRMLIDACLATNEFTISLETRPELSAWAWYRGAILQYHSAMLLMLEAHMNPNTTEAPRIWRCLDYIFELPSTMTAQEKSGSVIFALRDRLSVYQSMRKMRASKTADEAFADVRQRYGQGMFSIHARPSVDFSIPMATSHMDPQQFGMPPMRMQASSSESGSQQGQQTGSAPSPMDGQMTGSDEIDWTDWDKMFPAETSDFGAAELPDFNLGSFTTYGVPLSRPHAHMY
ncbi:Fungal specific transcription factor domain-containing protein 18 [Elsinoe fawcettii]|nr:Fungal specific transcription factor domain-containing protein 18 [Elsinoe fawcettii]